MNKVGDEMIIDDDLKWRIEKLKSYGFIVGERDPNRNQAFAGRYMVAEPLDENSSHTTDDAGNGEWCIVGDDLSFLVGETISFFELND